MANVYRSDHVGTLIKPEALLTAQQNFAAGKADATLRRAAEDAAIVDSLALQKSIVMTVTTDGEFRRADPDEPYASALHGLTRSLSRASSLSLQSAYAVTGKLRQTTRLTAGEVDFLRSKNQSRFKICLASPSTLALRLFMPGVTETAYPTVTDLATYLGDVLRAEITALFSDGVPYVQLNAGQYHALFEGAGREALMVAGKDGGGLYDELVSIDVAAIQGMKKPASATLAMRIDRVPEPNDDGDSYERMVVGLMERLPVDRFLLEYGEPQAHDFTSLAALPAGKMAVLGLVRTAGEPEEIGVIIGRIEQAAMFTQEDHLALSPRRAFVNLSTRPVASQLKDQEHSLLRTSEAVQQFWGLEL